MGKVYGYILRMSFNLKLSFKFMVQFSGCFWLILTIFLNESFEDMF